MSKQWILDCRVELSGATMTVEADTEEEAMAKAEASEWDDITYEFSELIDWKITSKKPELISE